MRKLQPEKISKKNTTPQTKGEFELYTRAKLTFAHRATVSSGSLQYQLHIPYQKARTILDHMIAEGFCEKQHGAWPCRVKKAIRT